MCLFFFISSGFHLYSVFDSCESQFGFVCELYPLSELVNSKFLEWDSLQLYRRPGKKHTKRYSILHLHYKPDLMKLIILCLTYPLFAAPTKLFRLSWSKMRMSMGPSSWIRTARKYFAPVCPIFISETSLMVPHAVVLLRFVFFTGVVGIFEPNKNNTYHFSQMPYRFMI